MANSSIIARPIANLINVGQRLYTPPNEEIRGIDPSTWYSPLQPIKPIAPEGTEPRGFQYWAGQNLLWTPRPDALYSAAQLKQLATYPLVSICISNVKDQLVKAPWEIQVKLKPGETRKEAANRAKGDENILKLTHFFEKPDREHMWDEWLRPLLDDMLVIDAATILMRRNFKGEIVEMPVLRGESITRYIDVNGWTPMAPNPAYAQNWWGIPLVNLSTDQLIYKPRNIVPRNTVSSQLYGMSPVEQLAPEIEVGIKRLEFTLAYYTEGSVPGLMQVVPKGTPTDKIAEAMVWMNSELAGNLAARRQIRMIQGWNEPGKPDQIVMTKEPLLADAFDEMHIKKIAFGLGVSPQRLSRQVNRASAEQQDEAAELEGTMPYFSWFKRSVMDYIIQYKFGLLDYEWVPDPFREPSFDKAAEAVNKVMSKPVMTINEVRDRLGLEPRADTEADQLGMATSDGWLPLKDAVEVARARAGADPKGGAGDKKPASGDNADGDHKPNGDDKPDSKPNGKPAKAVAAPVKPRVDVAGRPSSLTELVRPASKDFGFIAGSILLDEDDELLELEKTSAHDTRRAVIHPGRSLPQSIKARHALEKQLTRHFTRMRRKVKKTFGSELGKLHKSAEDELAKKIEKLFEEDWLAIAGSSAVSLEAAAQAGVAAGATQLELEDEELINKVNEQAIALANYRAAEMVGMRYAPNGDLMANPDARWAISDTTRDKIREIITEVFEEKLTELRDVEEKIDAAGIFNDQRASMIARTEIANVQANANLIMWQLSGVVKKVSWVLSGAHGALDECDMLADAGPYDVDQVPEFPAHPNCLCSLVVEEN